MTIASLRRAANELMEKSGGKFTFRQAAKALALSPEDFHKKLVKREALGLVIAGWTNPADYSNVAIPRAQFVEVGGKPTVIEGVKDVIDIFYEEKAGSVGALQFLVEHNPNLNKTPIDALKEGGEAARPAVIHATRAYLGLDEG